MADENKKAGTSDVRKTGRELVYELKEALGLQGDFRDILKDSIKELQKSISTYDKINARLENLKKTTVNVKEINKDILKNRLEAYSNERKLGDLDKKLSDNQKKSALNFNDKIKQAQRFEAARIKAANDGNKQLEERFIRQLRYINDKIEEQKESLGLDQLSYAQALKTEELFQETENRLQDQLKIEKEINKQLGLSGGFMQKFAEKLGFGQDVYEAMSIEARKLIDINGKVTGVGKWKVLKAGIKEIGNQIKESLNDPLLAFGLVMKANNMILSGLKSAFNFIVDIGKKVLSFITGWNSQVFEFAKNLGVGETQSRMMMNHFQEMALTSGPLFLGVKGISEAFASMTESLGFIAPMNDEMLTTATLIQRQFGLTADHIQAINTISALSGKSFKDTFDTINAISKVEGGRNRIMMTERQTMGQISKLSSLVLMNFKGNIPALTEAVVRAKKLGVELNDIQGTTGQFLDFESSISKEFEAQMFTGEDLNLQQLRRLALAHDTKGMMEEIGRRIPTLDKWNNMNTLAQEAYAEALGMSSEKIAEIIQKQQIANRLGVDASLNASEMYRKLSEQGKTHDQIVDIMKAAGAEQYLNAAMSEKIDTFMQNIKNTLGQMLEGELGQTITKFLNLLNNAEKIKEIVGQIQGFVRGIVRFFGDLPKTIHSIIKGTATFLGLLAAAQIVAGGIMIGTGVNPIGGAALIAGGIKMGGVAAAAGYASSQLGDLITVSDNAARNQVYSSPIVPTQQSAAKVNQPINVNVNNNMTLEGDKLYLHTLKNIQSTPPMDNNQGQYFTPNSISFSGQPAS